jgi:hypothetical protein
MIMQLNCIPAGMELFPAIDEEQLEFIKRVINDSDYYIPIIGGRYGPISSDGISYNLPISPAPPRPGLIGRCYRTLALKAIAFALASGFAASELGGLLGQYTASSILVA